MERSFDLGADAEAFIDETLEAGRYETAEDVVRRSLELLREHEAAVKRLNEELQIGFDAADRGDLEDADVVLDRLKRKYRQMAAARRQAAG